MRLKRKEEPSFFMGQYAAKLSRRGSFSLPKAFHRKLLAEGGGKRRLYFLRLEGALCIYSAEGLPERMRQISAAQESTVTRYLWAQASEGEISCSVTGRVTIPPRLLEASGLTPGERLTLVGMKDCIEVWSQQAWDAVMLSLEQDDDIMRRLDEILR